MRKIIIVLILLLKLTSSYSQEISIGKLKLGLNISDFSEIEYRSKNYKEFSFDYRPWPFNDESDTLPLPSGVRVFEVNEIWITEHISIKNVILKFYNDTLYHIIFTNSEIDKLLMLKYSNGCDNHDGGHIWQFKDSPHIVINTSGYLDWGYKYDCDFYNTMLENRVLYLKHGIKDAEKIRKEDEQKKYMIGF